MAEISLLRRRMIEDMTVRNLSPATQQSYLSAVSKFSRHFGRSPDRLGLKDVHAFQVHLVATGISWPALNQIVCALRFFYGVTLGQDTVPERIAYAREPSKLPVVLSADEAVRFLEAISSLKSRTALTTVYAAGPAVCCKPDLIDLEMTGLAHLYPALCAPRKVMARIGSVGFNHVISSVRCALPLYSDSDRNHGAPSATRWALIG